jgi:hypothetical protein
MTNFPQSNRRLILVLKDSHLLELERNLQKKPLIHHSLLNSKKTLTPNNQEIKCQDNSARSVSCQNASAKEILQGGLAVRMIHDKELSSEEILSPEARVKCNQSINRLVQELIRKRHGRLMRTSLLIHPNLLKV